MSRYFALQEQRPISTPILNRADAAEAYLDREHGARDLFQVHVEFLTSENSVLGVSKNTWLHYEHP